MAATEHRARSVFLSTLLALLTAQLLCICAEAQGQTPRTTQTVLREEQGMIQRAVAAVSPAIVRIETVGGVDLVGDVLIGSGPTTGVVIDPAGYIITSSFNFASRPTSILVIVNRNGEPERFAAEVVATDHAKMLTLLKIPTTGLKALTAVPREEIQVGQRAIALGRTFDLNFPNLSLGIISALNRIQGKAIQTDAKTSPVNYGGALIDLRGRCFGIIVPLSPQESGETAGVETYDSGIGFAIPLSDIRRVLERMMEGESLYPGLMGVGFNIEDSLSQTAQILRVRPQSPADKAGLKVNDVITAIDGREITRLIELRQVLGNRYAGESITVAVKRGEETIEQRIELTRELIAYQFLSIGFLPTREIPEEQRAGVGVRHVFEQTAAATAGLTAGDRVLAIDGTTVSSPSELTAQLSGKEQGTPIALRIQRGTEELELSLTPDLFPNEEGATNVPPPQIAAGEAPEQIKRGRFNQQLPGSERTFWMSVPENYHPEATFGLLVWVHPAGNAMEADMLRFWREECQERGIILAGPRAENLAGWSATDEQHVKDIVDWVREQYRIDPSRIAVMGAEEGGAFATRLAFKYRDQFRGLIALESPLRMPPPDNDPNHRLLIAMTAAPATRQRERIEKSVELLRKQRFPTALIDSEEPQGFSADLVNSLVQWLDALDRL